ncbi:hypothetical protein JHK84_047892 [Glycine max]|nr:hypothetical protein JHK84_047892 [Glycine max]
MVFFILTSRYRMNRWMTMKNLMLEDTGTPHSDRISSVMMGSRPPVALMPPHTSVIVSSTTISPLRDIV